MPREELYTAKGVDHDYNFLAKMERDVLRVNKRIVEEKRLVDRKELLSGGDVRAGFRTTASMTNWEGVMGNKVRVDPDNVNGFMGKKQRRGKEPYVSPLEAEIRDIGVRIVRAPKGMMRNVENGTKYSKVQRCLNWTVECFEDEGEKRTLMTCLGKRSIGRMWGQHVAEVQRQNMTKGERKRMREEQLDMRSAKRVKRKVDDATPILAPKIFQHSTTSSWKVDADPFQIQREMEEQENELEYIEATDDLQFYLLQPNTPARLSKVLVPIDKTQPLNAILSERSILEYPTIYILPSTFSFLNNKMFMLEEQYLKRKQSHIRTDIENRIEEREESDDTSSSKEITGSDENPSSDESTESSSSSEEEAEDSDQEMADAGLKVFM